LTLTDMPEENQAQKLADSFLAEVFPVESENKHLRSLLEIAFVGGMASFEAMSSRIYAEHPQDMSKKVISEFTKDMHDLINKNMA